MYQAWLQPEQADRQLGGARLAIRSESADTNALKAVAQEIIKVKIRSGRQAATPMPVRMYSM